MGLSFFIQSSDPELLEQATRTAEMFARPYQRDGIAGIVFLGAVARGYFDRSADIDIIFFKTPGSDFSLPSNYHSVQGFEVHTDVLDMGEEATKPWDMAKRWAYSFSRIHYDPDGLIAGLLKEKVPLKEEERRWLLMEGMTQSDWYIQTLTRVWVERGSLTSAHQMFWQGLNHFYDALFGLNNQLVADVKWRYYAVERLPFLPTGFHERIREILLTRDLSAEELERRREAFSGMWQELLTRVEQELQMTYEEFGKLV